MKQPSPISKGRKRRNHHCTTLRRKKTEPLHPETTPGLPGTTEPAPTPASTQPPAPDAKSDDLTSVHISEHLTEAAKPTDGEKGLTTADSKSVTSITSSPDDGGHSTATTTRKMPRAFAPVAGQLHCTTAQIYTM